MRHIILNFHGIGECPGEREPGEAAYWIRPDLYAEVLDLVVRSRGSLKVDVTFDDGNASDILIGAEGLARHGMVATFFVLADRIDAPGCLSAQDVASLMQMGHAIGSHGAAHVDWTTLDSAGLARELDDARRLITKITGGPVDAAAIPFGRYNRRVLSEVGRRSYREVYSSDGGPVLSRRLPLPRTSLRSDMTVRTVETILTGPEPTSQKIRRWLGRAKKRWL